MPQQDPPDAMARLTTGAAALCLLVLAAAPALAATDPAACPAAPIRVVHSIGAPTEYRGTYRGIPDLCYLIRGDGQGYFYYGVWRIDWPGAGMAYPALKTVIAGPQGTSAAFVTRTQPGLQWIDTLRNEGIEPITVGDKTYRTLRLAHERQGIEGNVYHSIITSWRDVGTGMTLKTVENQIAGQSYGPQTTWNAIRIEPVD